MSMRTLSWLNLEWHRWERETLNSQPIESPWSTFGIGTAVIIILCTIPIWAPFVEAICRVGYRAWKRTMEERDEIR